MAVEVGYAPTLFRLTGECIASLPLYNESISQYILNIFFVKFNLKFELEN